MARQGNLNLKGSARVNLTAGDPSQLIGDTAHRLQIDLCFKRFEFASFSL